MQYLVASEDVMLKLPRGLFFTTKTGHNITYSIMLYTDTKNYSISCDSFNGLLVLVDEFFSPSTKFKTLTEYKRAIELSLDDTQKIDLNNLKKAA